MTNIEKTLKLFEEKFPLEFFATQDWKYDYKNPPQEFEFSQWQREATVNAQGRKLIFKQLLLSFLTQTRKDTLEEVGKQLEEKLLRYSAIDGFKVIRLVDVKSLLAELKDK